MNRRKAITLGLALVAAGAAIGLAVFSALHGSQLNFRVASPQDFIGFAMGHLQIELAVLGTVSLVVWLVGRSEWQELKHREFREYAAQLSPAGATRTRLSIVLVSGAVCVVSAALGFWSWAHGNHYWGARMFVLVECAIIAAVVVLNRFNRGIL